MSQQHPGRYLEPYRRSHRRYGMRFEVTCWASEESQQRRFEVFTEMCPLRSKRILDAGCSRGDFAAFLLGRGIAFAHYVGIDALPEVIEYARRRELPGSEFHCADVLAQPESLRTGDPDVICISGTLNTMADAQIYEALEHAWSAAGEALLFNFLSDRCGAGAVPQTGYCRRTSTLRLLEWATDRTWDVAFRQDYFAFGHDGTIVMRKA